MTIEERLENAKHLQRGDISLLAETTGKTINTVSRFVNGKTKRRSSIQKAFEELVEIRKKQSEEVGNRIREAAE